MILFGDIHNHCGMTYGFGSLNNALKNARSHLDFCAVTGHAFWPDIPPKTSETEFLVKFHQDGFAKLKRDYAKDAGIINGYNEKDKFTTFLSYEMHSSKYGDHHVVSGDEKLPLITDVSSPKEWYERLSAYKDTVIIPHHIAYTKGYRGISWDDYDDKLFPVVEVVSKHGCSMSDMHPFAYYHTMGGRDSKNTVYEGLKRGYRFGFVGSTDHHAGYPGSYGDGCIAVDATENSRDAIMSAIKNRRTYAVRGDKIKCDFSVNGSKFGAIVPVDGKERIISYNVELSYFLDKLIVYKNLVPIKIVNGEELVKVSDSGGYKIRLEFGWGSNVDLYTWDFDIKTDGKIVGLEKTFRGRNVLAPTEGEDLSDSVNEIDNRAEIDGDNRVFGRVQTVKNETTTSPSTSAVILTVEGDKDTSITINVNGFEHTLKISDLLAESYTYQTGITNSQCYKLHLAVPESKYKISGEVKDDSSDSAEYHLEVFQKNDSMAFVSPVYYVEKTE